MRNPSISRIAAALSLAVATATFSGNASAAPIGVVGSGIAPPSLTENVYYRRYYHRHYGYYRHYGRYGYNPYYSPAGALAGTAADVVSLPARALFGGPYGY